MKCSMVGNLASPPPVLMIVSIFSPSKDSFGRRQPLFLLAKIGVSCLVESPVSIVYKSFLANRKPSGSYLANPFHDVK